jgi:hypothetical protein
MEQIEIIQSKIYEIRDQKVMLDFDLAEMYGTETKYLKRAVKNNLKRFPSDFMFELTKEEFESLRCKNSTSKRGGTRYMPYAFTEHGVAQLSSVLNSEIASTRRYSQLKFPTLLKTISWLDILKTAFDYQQFNIDLKSVKPSSFPDRHIVVRLVAGVDRMVEDTTDAFHVFAALLQGGVIQYITTWGICLLSLLFTDDCQKSHNHLHLKRAPIHRTTSEQTIKAVLTP